MPVVDGAVNWSLSEVAVNSPGAISLSFDGDFTGQMRARMLYAFRVFAAIYNYKVVEPGVSSSAFCCVYTQTPLRSHGPGVLLIPARYRIFPIPSPTGKLTKYCYAGEKLYLTHGVDETTGNPDWLGEIFEWLSSSHEMRATRLDSVGRIPYSETIFGQSGITPRKPYASLLMAWMQNALRNGSSSQQLPKAPSPVANVEHIVLSSHDVDFYYTSKTSAYVRLLKNLVISWSLYRSPSFFADNLWQLVELFRGKRVGDYLPPLLQEMERCCFRSTFFAVSRRGHRRDPNYRLQQIASSLAIAKEKGFSVGVHGSYRSGIEDATLAAEAQALANALGEKSVLGGRQHWLRFDRHEKLFRQIEDAGLIFDSTLGFPETVGFRNGASFAFPPYDFESEAPFRFLEFPLALMDGSIEAESRISQEDPQALADEVLGESRRWGWGGIAILWHNPMESISVPREVNRVFWNCAEKRNEFQEMWMSSDQFLQQCLSRYHNAGLLDGVTAYA